MDGWVNKEMTYIPPSKRKSQAGGVVQVMEHLPSKHEALSSRPSITKIEKKTCLFAAFIGKHVK
jgi:hypothetical protein